MPSELKRWMAGELARRYVKGTDYLVVGCTKLTGSETTELRRTLRKGGVRMEVVKNSIATRVLAEAGLGGGCGLIEGPSALVTGGGEFPEMCRVIMGCVKKLEKKLQVRGGMMGETVLDAAAVEMLARIPPLPVLHARIAGCFQTPLACLASAFQSLHWGIACALEGIRRQRGESPESAAS